MLKNHVINLLIIEDEEFDIRRIEKTIDPFKEQLRIKDIVSNGKSALDLLRQNPGLYDVVIMDFQIAGSLSGESLIRKIKSIDPTAQIIVITKMTINLTDFGFANSLLGAGAVWYLTKYPGDIEDYIYQPTDFILSIVNAFEKKKLEKEKNKVNKRLEKNIQDLLGKRPLIGESDAIKKLREQIDRASETDMNIMITGQSGTGKELVAKNIHYLSKRRYESFVPINCASIPDSLIESELFGYEKGSFTGATKPKQGLFEIANEGTIFLDEIAELPLSVQSTLLRVLQEGELDKIGRTASINVNVRIMAATNKILEKEVQEKRFRQDLYYRLNVILIHVPSLKERRSDIPLLIDHYTEKFSLEMNQPVPSIDSEAMEELKNYPWPGNIRELQNVVQRLIFSGNHRIEQEQIDSLLGFTPVSEKPDAHLSAQWDKNNLRSWRDIENDLKTDYFQFVRNHTQSDAQAAKILGLAPPNFHRMCKQLGLK